MTERVYQTTRGPSVSVNSTLPDRWWLDEGFADEVFSQMRRMLANGTSQLDVARATGVSSRTVQRFSVRERRPLTVCGMPIKSWDDEETRACENRTLHPSGHCHFHRDGNVTESMIRAEQDEQ